MILESISTAGSGGFLLIFFFVNIATLKLRDKVKINPALPLTEAFLTFTAFLILMLRMAEREIVNLATLGGLIAVSLLSEFAIRFLTGREIKERLDKKLVAIEENTKNWDKWIEFLIKSISETFEDAEVFLVGSIARGDVDKAHDVDILVLTNNPPANRREAIKELKRRASSPSISKVSEREKKR